jgi:hypothetical protein
MNHKSMKRSASAFKCHINGVMTYKQPLDDEEHRVFATSERALMNMCPLAARIGQTPSAGMLCSSSLTGPLLLACPLEVVMNDTLIEVPSHEGDDHVQRGKC